MSRRIFLKIAAIFPAMAPALVSDHRRMLTGGMAGDAYAYAYRPVLARSMTADMAPLTPYSSHTAVSRCMVGGKFNSAEELLEKMHGPLVSRLPKGIDEKSDIPSECDSYSFGPVARAMTGVMRG